MAGGRWSLPAEQAAREAARLLASTQAVRARHYSRLRQLLATTPADVLVSAFDRQRLLPLLGTRALSDHAEVLSPSFAAAVDATLTRSRARSTALETLSAAVIAALERAEIETLPLKGVFLARRLYDDPGMRQSGDIDMLVSRDRLDEAAAALTGLGYALEHAAHGGNGRPQLHHRMVDPGRALPPVELHWRVHWYEESFSATMLAESSRGPDGWRCPRARDELVALLLFYARDGFLGLRLAADLAAWWDLHAAGHDEPWLEPTLERHPELSRVLLSAAGAAERAVGVSASRLTGQRYAVDRRGSLALELANHAQRGDRDRLLANLALVDGLLSPPGQLCAFARRHLLLDRERIEEAYGVPDGARWRGQFWRFAHPPKLLLRFLLGMGEAVWCGVIRRHRAARMVPT